MELQEQVISLQSEIKAYKEHCERINAEKLALDQMLVECLKSSLTYKTDYILKDEQNKKMVMEIEALKKELESLKSKENVIEEIAA